jgi:hypothetical protein
MWLDIHLENKSPSFRVEWFGFMKQTPSSRRDQYVMAKVGSHTHIPVRSANDLSPKTAVCGEGSLPPDSDPELPAP